MHTPAQSKTQSQRRTQSQLTACGVLFLLGVAGNAGAQDKFSTDWYLHHPEERSAKLLRCERFPTESIGKSCANARTAERIAQEKAEDKKSDVQSSPAWG